MKVAIIGANGQLGADLVHEFTSSGDTVVPLTHADLEVSLMDSVAAVLRPLSPDLIVNTAAMHHVERCEQDAAKALAINAVGPRNLAAVARELGAMVMHVSTDYVFDGSKRAPYEETDPPRPLNVYGTSKLAGEYFVRHTIERHFVVRSSGLYGKQPCRGKGGLNFVELMLKRGRERGAVRVVDSETVTPTSTRQLARQMAALSRSGHFGLFHATAEGQCSWYDFTSAIFAMLHLNIKVEVADPTEFPSKTPRPQYSVLENAALKAAGLNCLDTWQEGLREYLGGGLSTAAGGASHR
jgi:dTDP-4-dehydrorhamnose reductase